MLNKSLTRLQDTYVRNLAPAAIVEEGDALVYTVINGNGVVQRSTGVAGERFAGFAWFEETQVTNVVQTQTFTVPTVAPFTVTLNRPPILTPTPQIGVARANGAGMITYVAGAPGAGEFTVGGTNNTLLTFNAAEAGVAVIVTYIYAPTGNELRMLYGDRPFTRTVAETTRSVSVITEGDVGTDRFVVTDNWYDDEPSVYLGPNGTLTKTATGTYVGIVIKAPSPDFPVVLVHIES